MIRRWWSSRIVRGYAYAVLAGIILAIVVAMCAAAWWGLWDLFWGEPERWEWS